MPPKNPKHIAVLRTAALGDICMTIPLLVRLRDSFPEATIYWIIREDMSALVDGLPGIQLIKIKKLNSLKRWRECAKQLKAFRFDILLMPQSSLRANLTSLLIHADTKYGYDKLHAKDFQRLFTDQTVTSVREHLVDGFMRFATAIGCSDKKPKWEIPLSKDDYAFAKETVQPLKKPVIAICPTSSKKERNWPVERYVELIDKIKKELNATILLIGGTDKLSQSARTYIKKHTQQAIIEPARQTTLKELTALLQACDLLIAPDTGPAHLADALGTPVVGLYAIMSAQKTGPYYSIQNCVDKYNEAVKRISAKDPETISWNHRVHNPRAMELIEVEEVVRACKHALVSANR